jgi:hypothetical protein
MKFAPNFIFIFKNYLQQTQARFQKIAKDNFTPSVKEQVSNVSYQSIFKCNFHIVIIKSSFSQRLNFLFKNFLITKVKKIMKII